jgi:hypothetical protein
MLNDSIKILILGLAVILVWRSVWLICDKYTGKDNINYLLILLIIGLILFFLVDCDKVVKTIS